MMNNKGITKLIEECAELIQEASKQLAVTDGEAIHFDGHNLRDALRNEIADVRAACCFVIAKFDLDIELINAREAYKQELFHYWDNGGTMTVLPQ